MQQTRVEQGMNYYTSFTTHFPTVQDLAQAGEEAVLKLWQGLGYYSRARNLHKTAQEVVSRFDGNFPPSYSDLLSLKGIGPYTAAAIASFAFDLQHAVVDGNAYRVLSRYYGIDTPIDSTSGKKEFQQLADTLIPASMPALFNQAIMEFGAMLCTPNNPDCTNCPLAVTCLSGRSGLYKVRPVKSKKTAVRDRFFHYFHVEDNDHILVRKRDFKDVWHNLYEFPMLESTGRELSDHLLSAFGLSISGITAMTEEKHILSHQRIYAFFYKVNTAGNFIKGDLVSVSKADFLKLPIHRLMDKYAERFLDA